ncbi:MAG: ECF transporter S component [Clostridiales bacterium]|nr:ECF transporter S component [Clostridiales bacterium]
MLTIKNERARGVLRYLIPLIIIPVLIILGAIVFKGKRYLLISLGVVVFSLVLFITGFEEKKTGSRRLVIISVMVALCVVGRFIPFFKPITAITVITAIYLGGEAGFLTGALAALISNFYFGQGPWTPFQMFAWGMVGLIAGLLSLPLKRSRVLLGIYGVLAGVVYSGLMDVWTVLSVNGVFSWQMYWAMFITALPYTALYCASNAVFLMLFAGPFGRKLERVKIKYGV